MGGERDLFLFLILLSHHNQRIALKNERIFKDMIL